MFTPLMRALGVATLVLTVAAHGPARAGTPEQPQAGSEPAPRDAGAATAAEHRGLSLLLNAGAYCGFGGGLAFGTRDVGMRGTAGWAPLIVALNNGSSTDLKFYSALLVGPDVYARLFRPQPTADIGGLVGYRYSTLLGHGLAVGGYAQFALSRAVDVNISTGLLIFPDGDDRLKREQNLPSSTQFSFPGPKVNFALSAGLAFFP
jgi:hypothetical protein